MKYISILFILASLQSIAHAAEATGRCPSVRLQNGGVRTRGRGRIIRFRCYDGYTLVGNKYATCIRGEWDTPIPVCVNSQCPELAKPDHSLVIPKHNGAILMYFCEPGYKLIGSSEIYCDGRQWNSTSPYCRDTSAVAPTSCDFEKTDLCWWEQDPKHDFDWRRHNFETPSAHIGTGPTHDHTLGPGNSGYYLYIEASGRLVNDTARIISPIYNSSLTHSGCFSFWFHMYGDTIGALRIYFKPEVDSTPKLMFNKEGNQGNRWLNGIFNLPESDSNFQIIIEGVRGSNYVSDIAVDDVAILHGNECTVKNNTSFTASEDDQIEIFNAGQSCRGRCINGLPDKTNSDALSDACHCTLDCAENSTCCPDYAEYCVLEAPSEMTDIVETTTPILTTKSIKITTREKETKGTERYLFSTKLITPSTRRSITRNISQSTRFPIIESTRFPIISRVTSPSIVVRKHQQSTLESLKTTLGGNTVRKEAHLTTIANINTQKKNYNETQVIDVTSENSEYLNPDASKLGLTRLVGALIGILAGVSLCVVAILVILKGRKRCKRGKNGSALSEDSDVRFLTTEETLDFTLARPSNDYNEL